MEHPTLLKGPELVTVRMPGSKSYTNRALLMAALTKGSVCLKNLLYSDDTEAMIGCLRTLGIQLEKSDHQIIIHGDVSEVEHKHYQLYAQDSGTTARFMLALLCIVPGVKSLEGSKRLNERPICDLVDALRALGAEIEYCGKEGQLPVKVTSSSLSGNIVHLKSDMSSQFCSAILLVSPYIPKGLTIHIKGKLISKPYVDMTLTCMQEWEVNVMQQEEGYFIPENQSYRKKASVIEGDFSSACYFFAMAALARSSIIVENLNPSSAQADRQFLDILAKMGNRVIYGENSVCIQGKGVIALNVDMEDCPDQVMTIAVLAAFAHGITKITGIRSLRYKETERVLALKTELGKMGIKTEDTYDTLIIHGGIPHAAEIDTYNDHRIAMAFAVASRRLEGITIRHPEVVNKTFPNFWKVMRSLK